MTFSSCSVEVETLRAEVSERNGQLQWLQERLDEIESEKKEINAAIAKANRVLHIRESSTRSEVLRLKSVSSSFDHRWACLIYT